MHYPGSRWWKFDFHVHTPASNDYKISPDSIRVDEWLYKAMQSDMDCLVVTDHNSAGWINKLKECNQKLADEQADGFKEITIFPGCEITVANASSRVHLLAVFDPEFSTENITSILGQCGITSGFGDDQQTSTKKSFFETVEIINKEGIAIPAHIDGKQGLLYEITTINPDLKKNLAQIFAAEFCDPHQFEKADVLLKNMLSLIAKVAGSDAHHPDDIGRHFSWVKMSKPSIADLRLALKDHEFCLKNQTTAPNRHPDRYLSELRIQNMRHCGRIPENPLIVQFHPHYNAIIGGRGTGKSTIIESIRFATRRDQDLTTEAPGVREKLDKLLSLDKGVMLNETEILLNVHRRGENFRIRWRHDGQGAVLEKQVNDKWLETESGDLKTRFPVSIFSQKQIYELASNPRGLLNIVDRSPEVNYSEWLSRWKELESRFFQLSETKRLLLSQLAEESQIQTKLNDVISDLEQYEKKGHAEILRQYQKRTQQDSVLQLQHFFVNLHHNISNLADDAELPDLQAQLFDSQEELTEEIKRIHDQTAQEVESISMALRDLAQKVMTLKAKREQDLLSSKWKQDFDKTMASYDHLKTEYGGQEGQMIIVRYGEWVQKRSQLNNRLKQMASIRKEIDIIQKSIDEIKEQLLALRKELFEKRQLFMSKVVGDNDYVRMELVHMGDMSNLEDVYRNYLNLENGKFASSVYDNEIENSILWQLIHWENSQLDENVLPQLISDMKRDTYQIAIGENLGNHKAFDNRLQGLNHEQPSCFDRLETWWPEDLLRVKYAKDTKNKKFENLEAGGSDGQKAAAILAFLLSYGDDPLIIDQPEDDLDNSLIYDLIVSQIHCNKDRRQVIIVSHNPNIVVNGDAELVHILNVKNGQTQINQQGGLGEPEIRKSICQIMEGGRDAFEKRYNRIFLEA
ncbi:MAG: PHP family phosphoesterase fused to chromosome segregation ATPase [Candidatus Magnetoglobus multicellularis str. Araruama]|uniref:PHP family phosphoesterase fused to chromosome segregation ATPase n=1 Tax=Candidatus Magnetoglobus multicellularis str. Araruama TaxID=890399 RepID=A0A1V1P4T4_9BACT|nr:MAG: PHP family phosphoesterase fused to chromosome segregation ATPase [Candidatus Magnetoglobus multicellularis str. Araruama]